MRWLIARKLGAAAVAGAILAAAVGCSSTGPTRSTESFCDVLDAHKQTYLAQMEAANSAGGLEGLVTAVSAVGDLKLMWKELAEVAPSEIQADAEAVSEAWQKQEDNATDQNWVGSLVTAMLNSGSMARVDEYAKAHCPTDLTVATEAPSVEPALHLAPGEGWSIFGDTLVQGYTDDPVQAVIRVSGAIRVFTVEQGELSIDAADLMQGAEVTAQTWTIAGKVGARYLVGLVVIRVPADGLDAEHWTTSLVTVDVHDEAGVMTNAHEISSDECDGAALEWSLAGDYSDAVILGYYEPNDVSCGARETFVGAWDPTTGSELWRLSDIEIYGAAAGSVIVSTQLEGGQDCERLTGHEAATGVELFAYSTVDIPTSTGYCGSANVSDYVGNSAGYGNRPQKGAVWTIVDEFGPDVNNRSYGVEDGAPLTVIQPMLGWDPLDGLAVTLGSEETGLKVYDPTSGEVLFSRTPNELAGLDPSVKSLVGGRLYLSTSDQDLEIEVATGQIVSKTASIYPIGVIGGYLYLSDGTLIER